MRGPALRRPSRSPALRSTSARSMRSPAGRPRSARPSRARSPMRAAPCPPPPRPAPSRGSAAGACPPSTGRSRRLDRGGGRRQSSHTPRGDSAVVDGARRFHRNGSSPAGRGREPQRRRASVRAHRAGLSKRSFGVRAPARGCGCRSHATRSAAGRVGGARWQRRVVAIPPWIGRARRWPVRRVGRAAMGSVIGQRRCRSSLACGRT